MIKLAINPKLSDWPQHVTAQVCRDCSLMSGWNIILPPVHSSLPLSGLQMMFRRFTQWIECSCIVAIQPQPPCSLRPTPLHPTCLFLFMIRFHIQRLFSHFHHWVWKMSTTRENRRHFICQFDGAIFAQPLFLRVVYHVPQCQQM